MVRRRVGAGVFLSAMSLLATPAVAAVPHVVLPGETLSGIAAAKGQSTEAVAGYNGLSIDSWVYAGETIQIPAIGEVAATPVDPAVAPATSAPWLDSISSPWGTLYLDVAAAESWNAMDAAALERYGIDLYPGGTALRLPHLRAAGVALRPIPCRHRRAGQPTWNLIARARRLGRRRDPGDALRNRSDRRRVRLVRDGPERVVARRLGRLLSAACVAVALGGGANGELRVDAESARFGDHGEERLAEAAFVGVALGRVGGGR